MTQGLDKSAASPAWEKAREVFLPEARRRKEEAEELLEREDSDQDKWNQLVERSSDSPEFMRQLGRQTDDPKLMTHVKSMREMKLGDTVAEVDSAGSPGVKYQVKQMGSGGFGCSCNDWRYKGSVNPGYECKHIKAFKQGKIKVSMLTGALVGAQSLMKAATFNEATTAFFDELSEMRKEQLKKRDEEAVRTGGDRPFSSLLTQDEEPTDYRPQTSLQMDEPEVILRGVA